MVDKITRCPKCSTAFRISDAHLQSAKGVVRCGSCLSVFNATEHIEFKSTGSIDNQVVAPTPATPQPESEHPQEPPPSAADDDDGQDDEPSEGTSTAEDDDQDVDDDEAWALELLKDDSETEIQLKKIVVVPTEQPTPTPTPTPAEYDAHQDYQDELDLIGIDTEASAHDELDPFADDADPFKALDELWGDERPSDTAPPPESVGPLKLPPEPEQPEPESAEDDTVPHAPHLAAEQPQQNEAPAEPAPAPAPAPTSSNATQDNHKLHQNMIAAIEPDALEIGWQENRQSWRRRLLWPVLVIGALLGVIAQVAWLEFHRLNRVEPYRSMYAVACQVLNCELPELRDLKAVQATNLVVRTHPQLEDTLLVDVILQNNARFPQVFPALQLTFTDARNNPIATRRFGPDVYLGGELAGEDSMPVKQPIHIALEITDPGQNAVGYNIAIVE